MSIERHSEEEVERFVLVKVLLLHPTRLAILELALMFDRGPEFATSDAVERAVLELTRAGLLRCDGRRIWPTRAALRFYALLGVV